MSEALARLHADSTIRASYVREVCRLLKTSNINVVKDDIEMDLNAEEMNMDQEQRREQEAMEAQGADPVQPSLTSQHPGNDLFVS